MCIKCIPQIFYFVDCFVHFRQSNKSNTKQEIFIFITKFFYFAYLHLDSFRKACSKVLTLCCNYNNYKSKATSQWTTNKALPDKIAVTTAIERHLTLWTTATLASNGSPVLNTLDVLKNMPSQ